ncbi:MAG: RNA 2',3'-cyclic phosphodiesterase [Candidatus Eisenbacteria bacterium]
MFAAIFPPPEVREVLVGVAERLGRHATNVKWVEKQNMHLTLRFFGDLTDGDVKKAEHCLKQVAGVEQPFKAGFLNVGAFPSPSRARVIWVGVEEGKETLIRTAGELEQSFVRAGLGKGDKPFSPHLTIGRVRVPARTPELEEAIRSLTLERCEFIIEALTLTKSELTPRGPVYSPLSVAKLGAAE